MVRVAAADESDADEPLPLPEPLMMDPGRAFVGRKATMADLGDTWRRAQDGRPQLVLATGDAGMGKTSLAAAFAEVVHRDGAMVLYGRCDEDPLVSYQPFVEALRHLIRLRPGSWPSSNRDGPPS